MPHNQDTYWPQHLRKSWRSGSHPPLRDDNAQYSVAEPSLTDLSFHDRQLKITGPDTATISESIAYRDTSPQEESYNASSTRTRKLKGAERISLETSDEVGEGGGRLKALAQPTGNSSRQEEEARPSTVIHGRTCISDGEADAGMETLLSYRAVLFATIAALAADTSCVFETDLGRRIVQVL